MSGKKNPYGSQYRTVLKSGNIKFVEANSRQSESLFETMTRGRVYALVGGKDLIKVVYFDNQNKHVKEINVTHKHANMNPHVHHGYYHNENDNAKGATGLLPKEKKMLEKVRKIWYDYLGRR